MATATEAPAPAGVLDLHTPFPIRRAVKEARPARIALDGPPGSGRTLTALRMASAMGQRIALIETQRGSASAYADQFEFDVIELDSFTPQNLVLALFSAGWAEYDVLIIDTYSAFWNGPNGLLEKVEDAAAETAAAKQNAGRRPAARGTANALLAVDSSAGWRAIRPAMRTMTDALLAYPGHLILTLRCQTETVLTTDSQGRMIPIRHAGKVQQSSDLDYDVDLSATLLPDHTLVVTKSSISSLDRQVIELPGEELGKAIRDWAEEGIPRGPHTGLYRAAYDASATVTSLDRLLEQLLEHRAGGMAAIYASGAPTTLHRVVGLRRQELIYKARHSGGKDSQNNTQPPAADGGTAPAPERVPPQGNAPAVQPPTRVPLCDGPTAPPYLMDRGSYEEYPGSPEAALASLLDRAQDSQVWDSLPAVLQIRIDADQAGLLDISVWCRDEKHREMRHLLDDRIAELKKGTLLDRPA
jgi:hypothetical protein